jgi:hypothetical protein
MTGMSLFKIAHDNRLVDYTNNIVVPTYKVDYKSEFNEWMDGDLIIHHCEMRKRLEGSFTLLFTTPESYQDFLKYYNEALIDGYVNAFVYANNIRELIFTQVFLEFELADEMPFMGVKEIDGIEITLKER